MITIRFSPFELRFRHPFVIAPGARRATPAVFIALHHERTTGYGEAALPPYLADTVETTINFIEAIDLQGYDPLSSDALLDHIMDLGPGHLPAKAAFDMALHDLKGRLLNRSCRHLLGVGPGGVPETAYTIGMGDDQLTTRLDEARDFPFLKIKAGGADDRSWIRHIRMHTDKPICVDANQGWHDKDHALDMLGFLKEQGAVFVEQPLPAENVADMRWLKEKSPLPLIADESFQTIGDLERLRDAFHGINVKLMKCGGMRAAHRIMVAARTMGFNILLGCMSESSCGVSAAAQLAPLADWADLDGPLLIANDPFDGITYDRGRPMVRSLPGNGITKTDPALAI